MGIIEKLKGLSSNKKEFKEKLKQAQEDDKVMALLEERKKSSNQREVERLLKRDEEDRYKKFLDKRRQKETKELWSSKSNSVINSQKSMLKSDRQILKEKNIFLDNKSDIPFTNKRNMFLR